MIKHVPFLYILFDINFGHKNYKSLINVLIIEKKSQ